MLILDGYILVGVLGEGGKEEEMGEGGEKRGGIMRWRMSSMYLALLISSMSMSSCASSFRVERRPETVACSSAT